MAGDGQPWYIFRSRVALAAPGQFPSPHDDQPCGFAGLWETYRATDGQLVESCALITTAANTLVQPIHPRMPALLVDGAAQLKLGL